MVPWPYHSNDNLICLPLCRFSVSAQVFLQYLPSFHPNRLLSILYSNVSHMSLIIVRIRCTKKMFRNKIWAYIAKTFSGAQYPKFVTSKIKSVMQHLHFSFVNVAANWRLYFWLFFHACTVLWCSVISNRKGPSTYIEAMKKWTTTTRN